MLSVKKLRLGQKGRNLSKTTGLGFQSPDWKSDLCKLVPLGNLLCKLPPHVNESIPICKTPCLSLPAWGQSGCEPGQAGDQSTLLCGGLGSPCPPRALLLLPPTDPELLFPLLHAPQPHVSSTFCLEFSLSAPWDSFLRKISTQ